MWTFYVNKPPLYKVLSCARLHYITELRWTVDHTSIKPQTKQKHKHAMLLAPDVNIKEGGMSCGLRCSMLTVQMP